MIVNVLLFFGILIGLFAYTFIFPFIYLIVGMLILSKLEEYFDLVITPFPPNNDLLWFSIIGACFYLISVIIIVYILYYFNFVVLSRIIFVLGCLGAILVYALVTSLLYH